MYKHILVPLDGSKLAEQVLPYVRTFAAALDAKVDLLRCIEPVTPEIADPSFGLYVDKVEEALLKQANDYLTALSQSLEGSGLTVSASACRGDPASEVLKEAEKDPTTLIAMSTHGRSGLTRWVLGSVTTKVLQVTNNPMLVVHPQDALPAEKAQLSHMVVPLDGSPVAEQILPHATIVAAVLKQKIVLVRVTPAPADYYRYMEYPVGRYQDFSKEVDLDAIKYLEKTAEQLKKQGVATVEYRLMHGQPAGAVVDVVKEVPQCMVAMTTHGRSGVGRWVLGSVADRVVRHTGAPVLLVRAKE